MSRPRMSSFAGTMAVVPGGWALPVRLGVWPFTLLADLIGAPVARWFHATRDSADQDSRDRSLAIDGPGLASSLRASTDPSILIPAGRSILGVKGSVRCLM